MARYLVHLVVVNDVVTSTISLNETGYGAEKWDDYHKVFRHNKISKAIETFKKCVESENARWREFNRINNDEYNNADVIVRKKDPNSIYKYFYEITGLGYVMHGSPECISRIWIEDTQSFKQKNNAIRSERVENQRIKNYNDIWGITDADPYAEELPFT